MVVSCSVKGCRREYDGRGTSFHKFPSDEKWRQQWINNLPGTKVTQHSKVCDQHFKHDDFYIACSRRMLKVGAVPSAKPVQRIGRLITPGYCYAPKPDASDPSSSKVTLEKTESTSQNITDFEEDGNVEFLEDDYYEEYLEVETSNEVISEEVVKEDVSEAGVVNEYVSEAEVVNEDVSEAGVVNEDVSEEKNGNKEVSDADVSNEDASAAEDGDEDDSEAEDSEEYVSGTEDSNEHFSDVEVSNEDVSEEKKDELNVSSAVLIREPILQDMKTTPTLLTANQQTLKDDLNVSSAVLIREPILQAITTTPTLVTANQQMLKIHKLAAQIDKMNKRVVEQSSQIKQLNQRIQRRNSKVALLESTIDTLKGNLIKCYDESLLVKGSQPKSLDFLRDQSRSDLMKLKKNYTAEIKKLALSLNLLSPKAYQFIRNTYQTSLPNSRTLSKWYQSATAGKATGSKVQKLKNIWSGSIKEGANQTNGESDAINEMEI